LTPTIIILQGLIVPGPHNGSNFFVNMHYTNNLQVQNQHLKFLLFNNI